MVRTLGVHIDEGLTLGPCVDQVVKTCHFKMQLLHRFLPYLTDQARIAEVRALILPHLDYCNRLLAGLPFYQIKRLQKVQNQLRLGRWLCDRGWKLTG